MAKDDGTTSPDAGRPRRKGIRGDDQRPRKRPRPVDDEEEDDDRPRRRRSRQDEDDEVEDRPRKRPRPVVDDEDDEEDERPRKRRSRVEDQDDEPRSRRRRPRDEDVDEDQEEEDEEGEEDEEEADDKPRKGSTLDRWQKVRKGLAFNVAAAAMLLAHVGAWILGFAVTALSKLLGWPEAEQMAFYVLGLGGLLYLAMQLPAVVGYGFSLITPNKKGTRALAIVCLTVGSINLVFRITIVIVAVLARSSAARGSDDLGISLIWNDLGISLIWIFFIFVGETEWILFLFYLKSVCLALKDRYQHQACNIPIALACTVIGLKLIMLLVMRIKLTRSEGGADMIGLGLTVLVLLVMFFFAMTYLKAIIAVRRRVPALPPPEEAP